MRAALVAVAAVSLMACPGPGPTGTGGGTATGGGGGGGGGGSLATGGGTVATGGGSTATGGGTTSTGGGFATGGGLAGTGGGTTTSGGSDLFAYPGFYDQVMVTGADDTVHLAHTSGAAENVVYGHCKTNCGTASAWNEVVLTNVSAQNVSTVGVHGLQIDGAGRLHLLISGVPYTGHANELVYATCAANCSTPSSWTLTDLSSLRPGTSAVGTIDTLMLDAAGGVSFFSSGSYASQPGVYYSCAANCSSAASWSVGEVLNGNPVRAARDTSGMTHVLLRGGATADNDGLVNYARCASACSVPGNWQVSPLGFRTNGKVWTFGLGVSPTGRVSMAYNQGTTSGAVGDNDKLFVNTCTPPADCLDLNAWSQLIIGVGQEGNDGATLTAAGEGLVLTTTRGFELNLYTCDGTCGAPASWHGPTAVDDTQTVNQLLPPWTGICSAGSGTWWPQRPEVALTSSGVAIIYNPYGIITCPASPNISRAPPIGRLITSF